MLRKYGVLIGLVLLLALAVYVNVRINKAAAEKPTPTMKASVEHKNATIAAGNIDSYFETFRTDRTNHREQEIMYIETIIQQSEVDAETLSDAQERKLAIVENMEKEFTIENLLRAKGFEDAAVIFHPGSVNVIIKAETLTPQQVAQVLDIVCRETTEEAQNIKVSTALK